MSRFVLPLFLALALVLGGSAQGMVAILFLELSAISLLAWAYARPPMKGYSKDWLLPLAWSVAVLAALQLVPLPPAIWHLLPGRDFVVQGDASLGLASQWRPISLSPDRTFAFLMFWTIPLAIVAAGVRRPDYTRVALAAVIVAAGLSGSLVGLAQSLGLVRHFFAFSSDGPTGQFANTNHLAALALATVPMIAAFSPGLRTGSSVGSGRLLALTAALILLVTVMMTGSLAMIALIVPVVGLSFLIAVDRPDARRWAVAIFILLGIAGIAALAGGWAGQEVGVSASTRADIWRHSMALAPHMFSGSGFGTFVSLYHLVEDPFVVDRFYVNHAHNDLIELAIEGGLPSLLLLGGFLAWFVRQAIRVWRGGMDLDPFARAASVVISILLIHSLVDFPLRTAALLATAAACATMLATSRPLVPVQEKNDLRPTRHRRVV